MAYRVEFARPAEREFERLPPQVRARLLPRIDALAADPRPPGVVRLIGDRELYRIRVGDYRVIYTIEDDVLLVLVVSVGHRSDVYRRR